ncbi:MAG: RNA polymerase sigma factor [Cellulosilyticaceae bacterium]
MCEIIYFTEELAKQYSKKIFGFAMGKTRDAYQAEELSQEIFLNIAKALQEGKEIEALDAYIYTLCYYTWSKYVRRNIKSWRDTSIEMHHEQVDGIDIESDYILKEELIRVQREITYLAKLHRQITIAFYFENKRSTEIAIELGISDSTVRWHLTEIRKKLKEGIEMVENTLSYSPKSLRISQDGWSNDSMDGLRSDLLCQNIVIACYGDALSIEEVSRKLGVAAAYLEQHIKKIVFMGYLKVVGKNKYQTNFWIKTLKFEEVLAKIQYEQIVPFAEAVYEAVKKRFSDIRSIGFMGCDLEENELLWMIVGFYCQVQYVLWVKAVFGEHQLYRPKRKDGTEHWVLATLKEDELETPYISKVRGMGIKTCTVSDLSIGSLQLDNVIAPEVGVGWRNFNNQEVVELYRIRQIILENKEIDEFDQLVIAKMVELGYVQVEDKKPKLLVPFLTHEEVEKLEAIMGEVYEEIGGELYKEYVDQVGQRIEQDIPSFISKEERFYHAHNIYPHFAVLSYLFDQGKIRMQNENAAKRIGTILYLG